MTDGCAAPADVGFAAVDRMHSMQLLQSQIAPN
jgi:hypothetical protein